MEVGLASLKAGKILVFFRKYRGLCSAIVALVKAHKSEYGDIVSEHV